MKEVSHDDFIKSLNPGDIGLILADNDFSTMQNWQRKKNKVPLRASHGFFMLDTPNIAESNSWKPSAATILKDIGDKTKCWVFRHADMTPEKFEDMRSYWDGFVEGGGHYGIGDIFRIGLNYFGFRTKPDDSDGEFCTELTGHVIVKAKLPYITELKPFEITPSYQRSWFDEDGNDKRFYGKKLGWVKVAEYLGDGKYWVI